MNIIEHIQDALLQHVKKTYGVTEDLLTSIKVTLMTDSSKEGFGDMSTNAALVLAKPLQKIPRDIAMHIAATFKHTSIETIDIAGPGFINLTLTLSAYKKLLDDLYELKDQFFKLDAHKPRTTFSVEFVSANPTGPLHLGHGRGGIIGDVLGNILKFLGHTVIKEFYINDAGVQIKKLGASFKIRCQQVMGIHNPLPEDGYQGEYLLYLAQDLIAHEGEAVLSKPENFFEDYAKNALLEKIKQTLTRYGINFDVWFSEKSLHEDHSVQKAIAHLTNRGFTYKADNALWFASTRFGDDKDRVLQKSTGEWTYVAADVAYLHNKIGRGANHVIMILGQDHHSYVVRLKGIMQALGYSAEQLDIILYQLVTIKESGASVKMSKRAGKIVSLEDVIETVGTDIARFFYLHRKSDAHLEFDVELALKHTEENPVYYAQYAYVRTGSILEKASQHPELEALTNADIEGISDTERFLIKKIISLKELLENIGTNYQTHLLTYYVLELAHLFHKYYTDNRVIELSNIKQSRARLLVIATLRETFKTCFRLLEIAMPDKM
jgi:arginyl-tRNA synthetase